MAQQRKRIATFFISTLVSSAAWTAGKPLDNDLAPGRSEIPITHSISECSPATTSGLRQCQEETLDLNGDGDADIVMALGISTNSFNKFYEGRANGLFLSADFISGNDPTSDIEFVDLDGDGDLDMVESLREAANKIYTNDGTGGADALGSGTAIDGRTDRSSSVAVGDVDNDGDLDLIFSNEGTGSNGVNTESNTLYLNETTTADNIVFGSAIELDAPGTYKFTRRVELLDAEGDGDLDIIATSSTSQADGTGEGNLIYVNQTIGGGGAGSFDAPIDLTAGTDDDLDVSNSIAVGDINGDSVPDLVFSVWQDQNRYYINNSSGGSIDFETTGTFGPDDTAGAAAQTSHVRLGDLDGDGDLDAVVTTFDDDNLIHLNTIGGVGLGFAAGLTLLDPTDDPSSSGGFAQSRHLGLSDLNEDGFPDILIANRDQLDLRYLNNTICGGMTGDACNPFVNQGQTINAQLTNPILIPPNLPYDMLDALPDLDVTDLDNVYPSDHSVTIDLPSASANWSCADGEETFACTGTSILPDAAYEGPITVNIRTTDGLNTSQVWPVAIEVSAVGGSPSIDSMPVTDVAAGMAYNYDITASDPDGDSLSFDVTPGETLPGWLLLTDNGNDTATLSGNPTELEVGDHDVSIRVRDGNGNNALQIFTITVTGGAPIIDSTALTAATEGQAYTYNITTTDPEGDDVTIAYDASSEMPVWLSLTDNMDGTATLAGTPMGADIGDHNIVLLATDTTMLSSTQAFTITVASAADAPSITLLGDNPLIVQLNDTFTDPGATATDAQDGDLTADIMTTDDVDTSTVGDYTVTYTVEDSAGNMAQAQRTVTVEDGSTGGGNTDPTISAIGNQSTTVGRVFSLNLAGNASDADGDTLTFTATGLPSSLSLSSAGMLTGTTVAVDATNSPYDVTVTVDDGNGGTAEASFTLTVAAANTGSGGGGNGGGGSFGLIELLTLLGGTLLGLGRRRSTAAQG